MYSPAQTEPQIYSPPQPLWTPAFLVEMPSWPRVFANNLLDLLISPFRRQPEPLLSSPPAPFWPDVFVNRRLPVAPFRQSLLYHLFIVVAVWGFSHTWLMRPQVKPHNPFENSQIVYYPVSEYLPPINDDSSEQPAEQKGEPAYARQRIVSLPKQPDNTRQTIVTPSPLKLHQDLPLPNMVAFTPVPASVPHAAIDKLPQQLPAPNAVAPPPEIAQRSLQAPALPQPVAPPPEARHTSALNAALPQVTPVAPAPAVDAGARLPAFPTPAVIAPPPDASRAKELGDMNISAMQPSPTAPHMPVPEQRAMWIKGGTRRTDKSARSAAPAAVPPPAVSGGTGNNAQAVDHIVALGLNPIMPSGPIEIPQVNRRGTFAAGPEGKPGAPGTPDIQGGRKAHGGGNGSDSPLAGITVAAGPVNPGPVAVAGPAPSSPKAPGSSGAAQNALLAALIPARPADIARQTRPGAPNGPQPQVEDKVFGGKKYYSMILNMPNLNSSGGSWVIRFAELRQTVGELTAPVATVKVDPAYPSELRREKLEGVVVLYAIIGADGTVSGVRVLRSLDERLDSSARTALLKWHFQPATKQGTPVDLEAVVQIPFLSKPQF